MEETQSLPIWCSTAELTKTRTPFPKTATYDVGKLSISAVDINEHGTHAVLAGKDILKIIKVQNTSAHDELDIREAVINQISTRGLRPDEVHKRREFLPARDVRWSRKNFSHIVATAASNGRIAIYDVSRLRPPVELTHIYPHKGQVNKLDFDPHAGYMLLTGSQDKWCRLWDIRGPDQPRGHGQYLIRAPVRDVRWCPTDAYEFALCTEEGAVQKWDIRDQRQPLISIAKAHEKSCYTLAWHPDGKHVATGSLDKTLKVWDLKSEHSRASRQKPSFQLRCPGAIMNLAWRPPCWSAEFAECGSWQSTQIATSYTTGDPRVHVWDFRRPCIPFKELNQYATRPTDILWASKDLIWTVGDSGFTQNDMSWAENPEDSMPPGAIALAADGTLIAVTENRDKRKLAAQLDPAALFLNIPHERLSGTEDGQLSRSLTDDEGVDLSFAEQASRRQSKTASRSAKLQTNTPSPLDDQLRTLPLDKAVKAKKGMFVNGQVGAMSRIPGLYEPASVTEDLANYYAKPLTSAERKAKPDEILPYLESAFQHNAQVALRIGLSDVARKWSEVETVVIPELKDWADNNRKERLDRKAAEEAKQAESSKRTSLNASSPFSKSSQQDKHARSPGKPEKFINVLLQGVKNQQRGSSDSASHGGSNMTTPRQSATFSSPISAIRQAESTWFTIDDAIDPIQPLPPSLANAHSTAGIASRALLDNTSEPSYSPLSSPQRPAISSDKDKGHRRSATETSTATMSKLAVKSSPTAFAQRSPNLLQDRTQDQRRAALRDYRAPTRQPFSLESPFVNTSKSEKERHDSADSFPMFPASTSSSGKGLSFGRPEEIPDSVPEESIRVRQDSDEWEQRDSFYASVGRSADADLAGFEMDDSPSRPQPYNLDGASDSKPAGPKPIEQQFRAALARSLSSQAEPKPRKPSTPTVKPQPVPAKRMGDSYPHTRRALDVTNPFIREGYQPRILLALSSDDPSMREPYDISDFRPIDITEYEPTCAPWSVSTYPMVTSIIELDAGKRGMQLGAWILCYLHPFFFDMSTNKEMTDEYRLNRPVNTFKQFMHPAFRQRFIQNLFAQHLEHLTRLRLIIPKCEFKKFIVDELGYLHFAGKSSQAQQSVGDQLIVDPYKLRSTCSECKQPMPLNAQVCKACKTSRGKCPICEMPLGIPEPEIGSSLTMHPQSSLLTYCHICGHSVHHDCMSAWLDCEDVEGECPVEGCGCDCGPGKIRDQRIAREIAEREKQKDDREAVRNSVSGTSLRNDPLRAETSPAAAQARHTLRKRSSGGAGVEGERGTQSSDERTTPSSGGASGSAWTRRGTGGGGIMTSGRRSVQGGNGRGLAGTGGTSSGTSGGTSFGRRVRLVEPDEEESMMREG